MNILYISCLNGDKWAGPTYSIPKQIAAQSKYDCVFWYNVRKSNGVDWKNKSYFHDLDEYPSKRLRDLPSPFDKPDLIVVEQFYGFAGFRILNEIKKSKRPYVIVPRGELTQSAQKRKQLKKRVANCLLFKKFAVNASVIQYLTEQEKKDSGDRWNERSVVIPNGVELPEKKKSDYCKTGIKCVFIGRIEPYHKGLDLLIDACGLIVKELLEAGCAISLLGPDYDGKANELREKIDQKGLNEIIKVSEGVYGEEKERELLSGDVFVLTSRFEGHPVALIEALSYGLPCIVTRGSNMKEEVAQHDAGWTAENTVTSLKNVLVEMIGQKETIPVKGANATRLASEYDWDRIASKTHDEYQRILNSNETSWR